MQHDSRQQVQQNCILHEDRQPFIEEIAALRSLAGVAGVADHLLAELDDFKLRVEHLDASAWELNEVRNLSRNELVHLSLAVLRAYNSQSN
jgi:hypothetical protein